MSTSIKDLVNQIGLLIIFLAEMWALPVHAQTDEPVFFAQPSQQLFDELGVQPESVELADINGDGVTDITTANFNSDNVTVLIGDGDGHFSPAINSPFEVGGGPDSVATADANSDGLADIVVANFFSNTVTVLLGDGTGGFSEAGRSPFSVDGAPTSVAVADTDEDGAADIITTNRVSSALDEPDNVTVLINDGRANFSPTPGNPFPVGDNPKSVAVGDINGDATMDIVTADDDSDSLTLLAGDGSGGFSELPDSPLSANNGPRGVALADINGDVALDIVVANLDRHLAAVTVLIGNGSGGFSEVDGSPFTESGGPTSIGLHDINGDALLDIVVSNTAEGNVTVMEGDGNGGFAEVSDSPFAVGRIPESVAVGDVNGDGKPDISTANTFSSDVSLLAGDGSGGFVEMRNSPIVFSNDLEGVSLGDIDGDGVVDTAITRRVRRDVLLLRGLGGGRFERMGAPIALGTYTYAVSLSDIDNDGIVDLVATRKAEHGTEDEVVVMSGDGSGGFIKVDGSPFPVERSPESMMLGDVNNDGTLDIVTANLNSDNVKVLAGDGAGGFVDVTRSPFSVGERPYSLALGDVTGDGVPDIVTTDRNPDSVTVLAGDGVGGFAAAAGSPFAVNGRPTSVALGDINSDGAPDIVTASGHSTTLLTGDGGGNFTEAANSPLALGGQHGVALTDVTGDGALDLILARPPDHDAVTAGAGGTVSVLAGDGGGAFTQVAGSPFPVEVRTAALTTGLLDGDTLPDILSVGDFEFDSDGEVLNVLTTEMIFNAGGFEAPEVK